jgi:hypothetical protein
MRRLTWFWLLVAVAGVASAMIATRQQPSAAPHLWPPGKILVVAVPEQEARALAPSAPSALGVYPESRRVADFFTEISRGAPAGRRLSGGREGALRRALDGAGVTVQISFVPGSDLELLAASQSAFGDPTTRPEELVSLDPSEDPPADVLVVTAPDRDAVLELTPYRTRSAVLVLGVPPDGRTPVVVTVGHSFGRGLLGDSVTRRPAIVTPYDLAATILEQQGVRRPKSFVGRPLRVVSAGGGAESLSRLGERLERDVDFGQSLTAATMVLGLGLGFSIPIVLRLAGRREWAARVATGGAFATAGYLGALFVPSPRGDVRAVVLVGGLIAGLVVRPRDRARFVAGLFVAVGAAMAILTIWAAFRPGGEPALSIWGDPLVSWRFFGLQNFEVAFLGGAIAGAAALGAPAPVIAVIGAVVLLVAGAPRLGANFVGVLTFGFSGALAVLAVARRGFRAWHVPVAGVVAVAAFTGALLADTGSVSSHGGRAVERISTGGFGAAVDVVRDRLTIGADAIRAMPGGLIWMSIGLLGVFAMIVWVMRHPEAPLGARVAIVAGLAGAVAVLALEDSGIKAAPVAGFPALMIWVQSFLATSQRQSLTGAASATSSQGV